MAAVDTEAEQQSEPDDAEEDTHPKGARRRKRVSDSFSDTITSDRLATKLDEINATNHYLLFLPDRTLCQFLKPIGNR